MMAETKNTIFRNKSWHVYIGDYHGGRAVVVESQTHAFVDYPIMYRDGTLAWDFPERIPDYIKKVVWKHFTGKKRRR